MIIVTDKKGWIKEIKELRPKPRKNKIKNKMKSKMKNKRRKNKRLLKNIRSKIKKIFRKPSPKKAYMYNVILSSIFLVLSVSGIISTVHAYMIQYHNYDLSYNMALMTNDINAEITRYNMSAVNYRLLEDSYDFGLQAPYTNFYMFSSKMMPFLIFSVMLCSMVFGYSFFWNLSLHMEKIKKK